MPLLQPVNRVVPAPDGKALLFHLMPLKGSFFIYISDIRNQEFADLHVAAAVRAPASFMAETSGDTGSGTPRSRAEQEHLHRRERSGSSNARDAPAPLQDLTANACLGHDSSLGNNLAVQLASSLRKPVHVSANLPWLSELDVDLFSEYGLLLLKTSKEMIKEVERAEEKAVEAEGNAAVGAVLGDGITAGGA